MPCNSGSCRDFAALFIEACRYVGLASRFVSGYLHMPEDESGNAATHAWAEVYLPGPGWKGFDPTSGVVTGSTFYRECKIAANSSPTATLLVSGTSYTSISGITTGTIATRLSMFGL